MILSSLNSLPVIHFAYLFLSDAYRFHVKLEISLNASFKITPNLPFSYFSILQCREIWTNPILLYSNPLHRFRKCYFIDMKFFDNNTGESEVNEELQLNHTYYSGVK